MFDSAASDDRLIPQDRAVLWEVTLAQRCLTNFSKLINAHAIVLSLLVTISFVGFLQPPKGWNADPQNSNVMFSTSAVAAFIVFNTLSLLSSVGGLVFYIYCSFSTIITLGSVPTPTRFDHQGHALVLKLRSALRLVALPSVQRRAIALFLFLATSLLCCVAAYISAGLAAVGHSKRLMFALILPVIPGCIFLVSLVLLAGEKMRLELRFDKRLSLFWTTLDMEEHDVEALDEQTIQAIDPLPSALRRLMKAVWPRTLPIARH